MMFNACEMKSFMFIGRCCSVYWLNMGVAIWLSGNDIARQQKILYI